ncbi:dynein-related subfamily AAA family protein [Rhodobacter sp. JA431]|uniref:AAA family ATPase n=1 Tax=Rhodobacter sp. JA431 TaxID=570013 RepID=UPI000BCA65C0|nr:AAA family ATPase [Rhodobacter sp. JA431]SOC21702.1 dynein-related subfamily AAA family protein [Rhodobacter sp. JA431]
MSNDLGGDPIEEFRKALEALQSASSQNNRKGRALELWFQKFLNENVAVSYVNEKKQIGNRFKEQRDKRAAYTVFLFNDDDVLQKTQSRIDSYRYPEHKRIYFFRYNAGETPTFTLQLRLLATDDDPLHDLIGDKFGTSEVLRLSEVTKIAEDSDAAAVERGHGAVAGSGHDGVAVNEAGKFPLELPLQLIVHGCPGSGKSFLIEEASKEAHFAIRTVFHPSTRYSDFVGGLRPESVYLLTEDDLKFIGSEGDVPGEPYVQYVVRPGPLLKAYRLACLHPKSSVVLLIEELSRAVASEVFGDMLQLLDRRDTDGEPLSGYSEYTIEPQPDIRAWLRMNRISHSQALNGNMRLPPNLYLWATMNRSDQNARQLDSAFLRRWSKKYLSYRINGNYDDAEVLYGGVRHTWGALRGAINQRLKSLEGVPEDKFIGPYFVSQRKLKDPSFIYEDVWGYIWNDVLKARAPQFFEGTETFAELEDVWDHGKGQPIGPIARASDPAS